MAKFYVESGNLQFVTHAADSNAAAIWAVHRTLGRVMPFLADQSSFTAAPATSETVLGETIRVSERGFGRYDGPEYRTFQIVSQWNHLVTALERLEERMLMTGV